MANYCMIGGGSVVLGKSAGNDRCNESIILIGYEIIKQTNLDLMWGSKIIFGMALHSSK